MRSWPSILLFASSVTHAQKLYVASGNGPVTSLALELSGNDYSLRNISSTHECGTGPTWLLKDDVAGILYCTDEVGSQLTSFKMVRDGSLIKVMSAPTGDGPVFATLFGQKKKGIAVAEYAGGSLSTWIVGDASGSFATGESIQFPPLTSPGPVPDRQSASHPHQTFLDPTGKFILVTDLGADLVRVFSFDEDSLKLQHQRDLAVTPGSGPRHGVFTTTGGQQGQTRLYTVNELSATIHAWNVTYNPSTGGIDFQQFQTIGSHGYTDATNSTPYSSPGNAPGEIAVRNDQKYLTISNRLVNDVETKNPDPQNPTPIKGDSLSSFIINQDDGTLAFVKATSSGGKSPRHFSTNKKGEFYAVANYNSGNAAIFGMEGELPGNEYLASFFAGEGQQIAAVVWDDCCPAY